MRWILTTHLVPMLRMGTHCPDALRRRGRREQPLPLRGTRSVPALGSHAERGNQGAKSPALSAMFPTVVLLLVAPSVCRAGEAPQPPRRGEAVAVMVEKGPAIDGTMNDPLWEKCPPWPMGDCTSQQPQKYKTWAKVLFGPTRVYIGVRCEEPDTKALAAGVAQRDGPVWNDDSVEIFLRPDPAEPVCQFVVNPRGVLYDARNKEPSWNSSAEVKAWRRSRRASRGPSRSRSP